MYIHKMSEQAAKKCGLCPAPAPNGKPIHGTAHPWNLPANAQYHAPVLCDFKVGDLVIFTNDNGVKFEQIVRGFAPEPMLNGRFVYVFTDCWWLPVHPKTLKKR